MIPPSSAFQSCSINFNGNWANGFLHAGLEIAAPDSGCREAERGPGHVPHAPALHRSAAAGDGSLRLLRDSDAPR